MRSQSQADVRLHNEGASLTARHVALLALLMVCGFLVVGQLYVTIPELIRPVVRSDLVISVSPERF